MSEVKKRGRPKKIKNKKKIINEQELILHLPIQINNNTNATKTENTYNVLIMSSESDEDEQHIMPNNQTKVSSDSCNNMYPINLKFISIQNNKVLKIELTNIACWWCTYNCDTLPIILPIKYLDDKYYFVGCFCSCNCALSYNLFILNDENVHTRYSLLKHVYKDLVKSDIYPAESKECLERYGGPITIEQYRKNFIRHVYNINIIFPPLCSINPQVEITNRHSVDSIYKTTLSSLLSK